MSTLLQQPRSDQHALLKPPQKCPEEEAASPSAASSRQAAGGGDCEQPPEAASSVWSYLCTQRRIFQERIPYHYVGDGGNLQADSPTQAEPSGSRAAAAAAAVLKLWLCALAAALLAVVGFAATARAWKVHRSDAIQNPLPPADFPQFQPRDPSLRSKYNCKDGYDTWTTAWSDERKKWCCATFNRGCEETLALQQAQLQLAGQD